jgi:UDP-3-O-[3-hydroxymyristoyl] N-acetylglucosamine deacetylase
VRVGINDQEESAMKTTEPGIPRHQQTLAAPFTYVGRGLHSGQKVVMRLLPADADSGIRFVRTDVPGADRIIPAHWRNVFDTQLCTGIANAHGVVVRTVEHLLAALRGCEIDNATIEVDGAEVPIMDGSADPFVSLIRRIGVVRQPAPRRAILITRPIVVANGEKFAMLLPHPTPWVTVEISFPTPAIGNQRLSIPIEPETFTREIAPARTFGFAHDIARLRDQGLAMGGSLRNAILVDGNRIVNEEGLRFRNEFVRHKVLDAIGDLALLGLPVIGHLRTYKCGHALTHELLRELYREREAWRIVTLGEDELLVATEAANAPDRAVAHANTTVSDREPGDSAAATQQ